MGTPWDRAAERYLEEWVPRFTPYHLDLVRELALSPGQRVLVTSAGPGSEVLAVARALGDRGVVRATDASVEMVRVCEAQVAKADLKSVTVERADAGDVGDGAWNAILCAFGLWQFDDRVALIKKWTPALSAHGKVGVLTWGPPDEGDPFELMAVALKELEPEVAQKRTRIEGDRESMQRMFEDAGLSLVRHTILRHTVTFSSAEAFVAALTEGCTWRRISEELGAERLGRVAVRFYDQVGGPTAPLSFDPAATLAIAARPGSDVELAVRPSVKAPPLSGPQLPEIRDEHGDWVKRIERVEPWDEPPADAPRKKS
ncbi:class I SAM-dependent methyltransferase [Labilithrix luteola]|uniref:class I SAM-dependent methyltransferase n=1 Tax=Labilithrix luteola TaxID=1391654 RepID=UPI0011BA91FC|nr:class I SAM-dependent methyltransferase [Labilithrix luteola]